jgi:hypothetical protein
MDNLKALESLGFTLPSPTYIVGAILFGMLGYIAYRYGKKAALPVPKWIGVALMLYPYAVSNTVLLYAIGSGLCVGAYIFRRQEF